MKTQNITLALPKELLRKVKVIAAERQTSISRLLAEALEELVAGEARYRQARARHLALLNQGLDLGTGGKIGVKREALHER